MKICTLSLKHSLALLLPMFLCNLSIRLTHAIFNERPNDGGSKVDEQYVDFLDETIKGLGEFFGGHDADDQAATHNKQHDGNKLDTNNNNSYLNINNNANNSNSNSNKNSSIAAPEETQSFYSEIETTLEQAADKVESLWLQFKQSLFGLVPGAGSANDGDDDDNDNNGNVDVMQLQKQQIKPIETTQPTITTTTAQLTATIAQPSRTTTAKSAISDKINAANTFNNKRHEATKATESNLAEQNLTTELP